MVTVDKGRKLYTIYRPLDPKIPPINSNPSRIFPEIMDHGDEEEQEDNNRK
jgi:hypothetical protein